MEKFLERENVLLGYSPRGSLENPLKTESRNSDDLDFNDVFGGPPRRYSMQEVKGRFSFNEPVESEESSPWMGQKEKPVFGTEGVTRRRYRGDGFFNDIFGGEESYVSPRRSDRDGDNPFGSNPGSRISSPSRTLMPKSEAFGTSLPAQFSLPAKLTKATEGTFASGNHRPYKMDGSTNGISSPLSNTTLSRFSSQAILGESEVRNDIAPVYHHSSLSSEVSSSNEELIHAGISDQKDVNKWKSDSNSVEITSNGNQFHFSIYKWAGRELPMLVPLRGGQISKLKEMSIIDKSASSNERIETMEPELSKVENHGISVNTGPGLLNFESEKQDDRSTRDSVPDVSANEGKSLPKTRIEEKTKNVDAEKTRESHKPEKEGKSLPKTRIEEKIKDADAVKTRESHKPEKKPVRAFIDGFEQKGNVTEVEGNLKNLPKGVTNNDHEGKNVMKSEEMVDLNHIEANKATVRTSEKVLGRSGVKGKVKEFAKNFSQETSSRANVDRKTPNQSSRWKGTGINKPEISANLNAAKLDEVPIYSVNKMPDVSHWVNKNLNNDEAKHYSHTKTPIIDSAKNQKDATSYDDLVTEIPPNNFKVPAENADDPFEDNFVVEELFNDENKVTNGESSEDVKALDAKIQQWSLGKKGNIRSLLSTLQYVLWPKSGWKPVPLVDLIESSMVKRSYQKALLCLHPDKLQQKGATPNQKYIAEKVFDILQEAWDHFNTTGV